MLLTLSPILFLPRQEVCDVATPRADRRVRPARHRRRLVRVGPQGQQAGPGAGPCQAGLTTMRVLSVGAARDTRPSAPPPRPLVVRTWPASTSTTTPPPPSCPPPGRRCGPTSPRYTATPPAPTPSAARP